VWGSFAGRIGPAIVLVALSACVREPAPAICPDADAGDLVVSAIGAAADGEWLEVENASGGDLDLEGLQLRFRRIDGGASARVIVRRSVVVAAGGRAVLARRPDADLPPGIAYGMAVDLPTWFAAGAVEVAACDRVVDRIVYDADGIHPELGRGAPGEAHHPCAR